MKRISVVLPLLVPTLFLRTMTEFTIRTLRLHADNEFELVVVEGGGNWFDPELVSVIGEPTPDPNLRIDKYLSFNPKIGGVKELNAALEVATGDYILSTGNDVIVPPHWDTFLLEPFERYPEDCGVSCLSAFEPGAIVGPPEVQNRIVEGMYSPFMMFKSGRTVKESKGEGIPLPPIDFDEAYTKIYQDSDFIMRVYQAGYRSYRSCRAHVHHLCRMTSERVEPEKHRQDLAHDEKLFYERWGESPLMMFGVIRYGHWMYGREHEALSNPINLHY